MALKCTKKSIVKLRLSKINNKYQEWIGGFLESSKKVILDNLAWCRKYKFGCVQTPGCHVNMMNLMIMLMKIMEKYLFGWIQVPIWGAPSINFAGINFPISRLSKFHIFISFSILSKVVVFFFNFILDFFLLFQLYLFYLFNLGRGPRPSYLAADIFMCPNKFGQMWDQRYAHNKFNLISLCFKFKFKLWKILCIRVCARYQ